MYNKFLFCVAAVFCVGVCFVSAKDANENRVITSKPESVDNALVDISKHEKFLDERSELNAFGFDECKCENGKCVRLCDVVPQVPCFDILTECVCKPEFAEKRKGYCEYCNCGPGINCTFKDRIYYVERICNCPEGYYMDKELDKCVAECNDANPCENGGTCSNQVCICPYATGGTFCEEILDCSDCVNRLEVNCLYDRKLRKSYCSCKDSSLHYDYDNRICIPCQCGNGNCENDITSYRKRLKCDCDVGYKEFNGYCKECNCGFGDRCEFDSKGKKICNCAEALYEREGRCQFCHCTMSGGIDPNCEMIDNKKRCFCPEGYLDVHGLCEDIDECELDNPCHLSTTCENIPGSFLCRCPSGYEGDGKNYMYAKPGEMCRDIDECDPKKIQQCWSISNVKCTNLPGSYKCECLPGYEPFRYQVEPGITSCVKAAKSWTPAAIVILLSIFLILVSWGLHTFLKERATQSR